MNIFIKQNNNPKIIGILRALQKTNNNIIEWNNKVSIFDLFEINKPDIIFITESDLNLIDYIKYDHPDIQVYIFKQSIGSYINYVNKEIDILNEKDENFLDYLVDDITYSNGICSDRYKCDFLILSDNINNENNEVLDICNGIGSSFNLKIYGSNKLNSAYYLGIPEINEYKNIIASCKSIIMFDKRWFYNSLFNKKTPLIYSTNPSNHFEFGNYNQLFQMCEYFSEQEYIEKNISLKSYSDFIKYNLGIT